jgi:transcriptional regulator with XRE-family HTH domain
MTTFSKRLIAARKSRGLSQAALGRKSRLQQTAISHFETSRRSPSFENLKRLADALSVTTDYLMGRSGLAEVGTHLELLADKPVLSAKDIRFLQRVAEHLIRRRKRER